MGKGKPRHNNENQLNKRCNKKFRYNKLLCYCYDGTYTKDDGTIRTILEFARPWCNPDGKDGCKCNPYNCLKMRNKWFASLSRKKQKLIETGEESYYSNRITCPNKK